VNRLLRLPLPEAYVPSRVEALRDRLRTKPGDKPAKSAKAVKPAKSAKGVKPAKAAKPAKKPARKSQPTRERTALPVKTGTVPAKTRTAQRSTRRSGHHGDAPRNSAQQPNEGSGRARRSRTLEGQRYG
jgi:cell division protein FtsW